MSAPRVSVIVPVFNAGQWLRPCVQSILGQSMDDLQLLLVDDGSTDGAVGELNLDDPRCQVITQANRGAAAARNLGLQHSAGRWISFVDADDVLHRDKLAHQLSYLAASPSLQITSGSWCRFHDQLPDVPQVTADDLWRPQSPLSWQQTALSKNLMMQPAAWLVARALIDAAGPWNQSLTLNDDGEYFARVMLKASQVGFCARALSFYRSGSDKSLSAGRKPHHFQSAVTALGLIGEQLAQHDDVAASRKAMALAWSRLAVESYPYAREQSKFCEQNARLNGLFNPDLGGGRWVSRLAGPLGWRLTRRLQARVYDLGYRRLGLISRRFSDRRISDG